MKYHGNHGVVGSIAFGLTGICYKIFRTSSKLFGKVLFFIFLHVIPSFFKMIFKAILGIFGNIF